MFYSKIQAQYKTPPHSLYVFIFKLGVLVMEEGCVVYNLVTKTFVDYK